MSDDIVTGRIQEDVFSVKVDGIAGFRNDRLEFGCQRWIPFEDTLAERTECLEVVLKGFRARFQTIL